MTQLDDILTAYRSGTLSAPQALEQLKAAKPTMSPYALSEGQRGLWVLEKSASGESGYNVPIAFRARGPLSVERLHAACEFVWSQHPVLRTVIEQADGVLQQRIAARTSVPWIVEANAPATDDALRAYLRDQAKAPFALDQGPLLRIHVVRRSADEHVVLFVIHHLVFDGTSLGVLLRTLLGAYGQLQRGERLVPAVLPASYREFVKWEAAMIDSPAGRDHRAYWLQQLAGDLPVLALPTDHPRATHANVAGRTHVRALSGEQVQRIRAVSAELNVSMSVVLLGVYQLLLHRYTGEADIVVGIPTAGRPQARFDELIGYFVNVIALRHRIAGGDAFAAWARALQLTLVEGLDHASYPFARVVRDLRTERRQPRAAIFQVAYEYQNASMLTPGGAPAASLDGVVIEAIEGIHQEGEYELVLEVVERATDLALRFKYDANLYSETTIARMADHYLNLLRQVLEQPGLPLSAYAPMTVAESRQVLEQWNATAASYPHDRGIHELFAEQAQRTPQATAVTFDGQRLTYRELDERSDQLARQLCRDGVRASDRVALCVERSLDLPIGLLGILKSGAAYVPLDPTYPPDRIAYMLKDSGARVVVTQSRQLHLFAGAALTTVCLDGEHRVQDSAALPAPARGDALAYVMYTSGSTGQPKGVMICHRAVVNFLASMARAPGLTAQDRLLAVTTYSFDISGLEIYLPLVMGAECHICSTETARDPKLLAQEIARVQPTVMQATPTTWSMLVRTGWQNRERVKILCGGEALPQVLRHHFVRSGWDAWNLYGPTETTIWSTIEQITAAESNSIGKPIANTQIYILDAYQQAAAVRVRGELCIAGDGVALGYLDQPALTAERFVADPFRPGHKMYRTGDLACWRPDGTIEYLGRGDGQVKVRGHRVELGEIEARLAAYPGMSGCAVVVSEREGHEYLAACCVLAVPLDLTSAATVRALREYLQAGLPDYMVPSRFLEVPALPLTPNGKLDRKRLAQIATAAHSAVEQVIAAAAPPSSAGSPDADSEIVERVRHIWQRALGSTGMALDDGFFDLGGDSVMAVTVAARIESEFGRAFGATEMFRFGTIRQIARHLQGPQEAPRIPALLEPAPTAPRAASPSVAADDLQGVAIIGISCQFPGANDHTQFWSNLIHGVESIQRLSPEALARAGVPASILANASYVPVQATIDGAQLFDAEFFKVSARDAELMDPQLRLLLQHGWKVVEDAGYAARAIPETGVWIASSRSDYATRGQGARGAATGVLGSMHEHVPWLLAQSGTIPTMISHRLGFKGPSQAVHSNCSSSLVAINAACRSLMGGETKYALVGAATIFAGDSLGYVHEAGMPFSSDGHVRTFDASADGTVGGEGVAVVLLKRAADAVADGDHIYALIRGVAVNNDGADKAGFYAPSVDGQTDVIVKALQMANVDARSIGYVEAHGTATALGDPIEVQAISAAYRRYTADTGFCGIGSVKTNIGHVDTAAGLAGLIKVALSLEHRELPPSLHYRQPNPRLALQESPFYVVDQRKPWHQDAGARRAAVSAFGIGGTNAHAILEEAPAARRDTTATGDRPALIVLSARTAEQLRERADQLLAHVSTSQPAELFDLAYTLQIGRDAMEHRVAFTATSVQMLQDRLRTFVEGGSEGLYRGEAHKDKETWAALSGDEEFAETIEKWLQRGKHKRLLELWAKGVPVDWAKLYAPGGSYARPRRVSLPGYPFAKQRHWLEPAPARAGGEVASVLHPLVQRNTSDLTAQRFSSTFHGTEFYLRDHVVNGRKILPAVCYLEMARVALERSAAPREGHKTVVVLEDVVWMRPVVVDGAKDVHVGLRERDDGEVELEIYSDDLHAQGRARLVDAGALDAERFDIDALRARCPDVIDGALCYSTFRAVGVEYGPAHQGISRIHAGVDIEGQPFALAHVTLPACVSETRDRYVLHPSTLDCALQATIGLSSSAGLEPGLPFALERLEILERSPDVAWVVVRPCVESSASMRKLDIEICDEQGRVCVRMLGFSARAIAGQLESPAPAASDHTMLLTPRWEARLLPEVPAWPEASSRVVLIGGSAQQQQPWRQRYAQVQLLPIAADARVEHIADALAACAGVDHVVWLAPASAPGSVTDELLIAGQAAGVIGLYRVIKALLLAGHGARPLGFTAVTWQCQAVDRSEQVDPTHAGVHGLIGSLAKEYEGWKVRLVDGPPADGAFVDSLLRAPADPQGDAWVYRAGEWYRQQLVACELQGVVTAPYRQGGVYVVIGGAGGIGEVFSEHVIRNHGARLVWLGRSAMSAAIEAKIARLAKLGPAPMYLACDAADRASLERAYRRIKDEHGQIHGVVHAAVVLLDKSLAQMEEDRFRASLAAKVDVSVRLAQVFAREGLDFVVLFSSLQSFAKAAGQSNYGAGCTFQDAFASRLALEWPSAVKVMNWGYWAVGSVASEAYRTRMAQLGFASIEPEEGMAALDRLLGGPLSQTVFCKLLDPQAAPAERLTQAQGQTPSVMDSLSPRTPRTLAGPQADPEAVTAAVDAFQRVLGQLLFVQLRSMGCFATASTAAWQQQVGMPALYGRWLDESVRILAGQGYLRVEAGVVVAEPTALDEAAAWSTWDAHRRAWVHDQGVSAQMKLADATLRALPEILRGRPATEIVFPSSSLELVEGVYRHNPVPDYFNAVLTDSLIEYVAARCKQDGAPRIRMLEIGAGTGATSAAIFERLKPYEAAIAEYCYTDISKAFLMHAEQAYGPIAPYLTYRLFNVEQALEPQGVGIGSFDVVIATNVLHATRNIRHTLRGAKAALKRNGVLLINEMASHSLFAHVTFGLLEGWWSFDDSALRIPGSPVLAPEAWRRVLEAEGLRSIQFPASAAHGLGQQLIVAESDGVIRQPTKAEALASAAPARRTPVGKQVEASARVPAASEVRSPAASGGSPPIPAAQLRELVSAALKELIGEAIKTPPDQIDEHAPLEEYGMDSLLVVKLTNGLKGFFPDLSSTLFFEHRTIASVSEYLVLSEEAGVVRWVGQPAAAVVEPAKAVVVSVQAVRATSSRRRAAAPAPTPAATKATTAHDVASQGIAIIGMSGRFPEARNVDELWDNLKAGRNCIREIPAERWDFGRYFDPQKGKPGKSYSKWGGFIEDVDKFDPLFFRMSPLEAEELDPQERLFLQEAYASIEDAGYTPAGICASRKVGVYVGVMNSTYRQHSTYWSIANRVSYVCDFQGPSMAVDTACSSSLTAIHLAVESLRGGSCEVAIAGGVAVIIDPLQYTSLSAMTMLSAGDRCKAFGAEADGFVDGEGVGALVLKPLVRAIQDGDHIYGVIRSSAVNAGGKTNGYTVPNPAAQRDVIQRALSNANIDPRTISYVEAHGTGTELGDPIEIAGLTQAFSAHTTDKQYCAIGSAKSNIGHLESAAGVAGVTKVLLQMRHRVLVPSLHSEVLNPHIDFSRTPFRVQHAVTEWRRPTLSIDGQQREYPRIAGISSFGAGGANAHVIIEEYEAPPVATTSQTPALILLSAKTELQLTERARRLLSHVSTHPLADTDLAAIAYTLQVGRDAMDHRLAFTAATIGELRDHLNAYLSGRRDQLQVDRLRRDSEAVAQFATDDAMQAAAEDWIQRGQYTQLLGMWVKGLRVAWPKLYVTGSPTGWSRPTRVRLPTYPFARDRYWKKAEAPAVREATERALHPLLQRNTSNLSETRFSSTLRGEAFFLSDHVINGQRILPGVAYLEMARAALAVALDLDATASPVIELRDIVWQRPLSVSEPIDVHIRLAALQGRDGNDGEIEYEIYTGAPALAGEDAVHAGGRAVRPTEMEWVAPIDIDALRAQCDRSLDVAHCYAAFDAMGVTYGAAHRGLASVQAGVDARGPFIVAQVKLPDCVSETRDSYVLHPSVLDSALQAAIGLSLFDGSDASSARAMLPFALDRLQLLNRSPKVGWVVMRPSTTAGSQIQKLDIDLCEESGHVCVRLQGFTSRVTDAPQPRRAEAATVLLTPSWEAKPVPSGAQDSASAYGERWVLLAGAHRQSLEELKSRSPSVTVAALGADAGADSWLAASEQVLGCVRSILRAGPSHDVLVQVVITDEPASELGAALAALLKSATQENPRLVGQVVILPHTATTGELERALHDSAGPAAMRDPEIRYAGGARQVPAWNELPAGSGRSLPWRDGGVYVITGGAGGLGMIFAQEILGRSQGAKVILTGRSNLSAARREQVEALQRATPGSEVEYRVLDVTDAASVELCVGDVLRRHGALHGILHAAGVTRDAFLINKEVDELRAVWAPKVAGAVNLDRATRDVALDAFILFSSLSGVFGNIGQSDYALANAALDRYATVRNRLVEANERRGRTISINWPLWEHGGMAVDAGLRETLRQKGLDALTTSAGVEALYRAWASGAPQVMVLAGDRQRLAQIVTESRAAGPVVAPQPPQVAAERDDELRAETIRYVKQRVAAAMKLSPERLESDVAFEQYGVDSILALKVVRELETIFGSLPKTLLFEYQSVEALAAYLIKAHGAALASELKLPVARPATAAPSAAAPRLVHARRASGRVRERSATEPRAIEARDIAVIGLAGRYPGADDIHELWENLKAGKDCITEVPPHRWDHGKYYDAEKGKPGKTSCKWGGFIRGTDTFDHAFFRISAQDAQRMDPQERILLEVMWHLLEDAGYTSHHLRTRHQRNVGVYVGGHSLVEAGASTAYTASRITEFLGLRGPSFVVDTFSASSATALHLACQGLLAGDCQMAIAAGICVLYPQVMVDTDGWLTTREDRRGFSTEGGFIFAEGAGAVLLKPLRDAMRDSDRILAVIKSTVLDSSGRAKRQFPSDPVVMANVIRSSLEKAGVPARTIGCAEPAVTGAAANDYTEVSAYTTVFRETTADVGFCAMGTIESNVGHSVASSGIAQLTKAILQLHHGELVPTIKMDPVNPELEIAKSPFFLPRAAVPWPRQGDTPRRALVTSRGADGTQVAVVLEEHPPAAERSAAVNGAQDRLFLLSAPSPDRLRAIADALQAHLAKHPASDLDDLAYTLDLRREEMQHRLAVIAASADELSARLAEYAEGASARLVGGPRVVAGDAVTGRASIRELLDEQAEARLLRAYVTENDLEKLARYWVSGSDVRGAGFGEAASGLARVVALPLYPFASSQVSSNGRAN